MKNIFSKPVLTLTLLTCGAVFNQTATADSNNIQFQVPQALKALIPVGAKSITLNGTTKNGERCVTEITMDSLGFSATSAIPKPGSTTLDPKNIATFQLGLGHKMGEFQESIVDSNKNKIRITAFSQKNAEEGYSSKTQSILMVEKENEKVSTIRIVRQEKGLFGFKTKADVACNVK